jgi:hypothetical protein
MVGEAVAVTTSPSFVQFDVWAGMEDRWEDGLFLPIPWVLAPGFAHDEQRTQTVEAPFVVVPIGHQRGLTVLMTHPQGTLDAPRLKRMSRWTGDFPTGAGRAAVG